LTPSLARPSPPASGDIGVKRHACIHNKTRAADLNLALTPQNAPPRRWQTTAASSSPPRRRCPCVSRRRSAGRSPVLRLQHRRTTSRRRPPRSRKTSRILPSPAVPSEPSASSASAPRVPALHRLHYAALPPPARLVASDGSLPAPLHYSTSHPASVSAGLTSDTLSFYLNPSLTPSRIQDSSVANRPAHCPCNVRCIHPRPPAATLASEYRGPILVTSQSGDAQRQLPWTRYTRNVMHRRRETTSQRHRHQPVLVKLPCTSWRPVPLYWVPA
jgi:hypothetical protein